MNLLGLTFSILLILSYGFYVCWDKHMTSIRLRKTYVSHSQAYRSILNQFESQSYKSLGNKKSPPKSKKAESKQQNDDEEEDPKIGFNRACARINLWPLIHEGRENHPVLYELTAKLLHIFYGSLQKEKHFENRFLDLLLASAKAAIQNESSFALEKLSLSDPKLQKLYYKMLKGTKHWDLKEQIGYPPLLDYIKAVPSQDKICVEHANLDLLTVLFNVKIAEKIYFEIHRKGGSPPTPKLIEHLASEAFQINPDQNLLNLLEYGKPLHPESKKTFVAEGDFSLRKNISFRSLGIIHQTEKTK